MWDKIKLETAINADALFEKLQKSEYMKARGYTILYATTHYELTTKKEMVNGVEVEKVIDSDKVSDYRLCYNHDKEMSYIHIRGLEASKEVSEFTFLIALGNTEIIYKDLANLANEIMSKEICWDGLKKAKKITKSKKRVKKQYKRDIPEQEILEKTIVKLKESEGDTEKTETILNEMTEELPDGELKIFFQEVEKILASVEEIVEDEDEKRLSEALSTLRTARAKFKKGNIPPTVSPEIAKSYKEILDEAILVAKMIKGLSQLFE